MIFKQVVKDAKKGMEGSNTGLPMGLPMLESIVNKVQRECYYLVAGKTSAGKTAFVDQCFVLAPFDHYMSIPEEQRDFKIDWLYFSLEIAPVRKFTKISAREMWRRYHVETSVAEILSQGDNELSPEKLEMLMSLDDYFQEFENHMHIYDAYDSPMKISNQIHRFYAAHGEFVKRKGRTIYTPNHPNHYVIIIIDTINLVTPEDRQHLKGAIDQISKDMIWYRNICGATPVVCQQYNADISDPKRFQQKRFEPIADDLEDSKRPSKDCNTYFSVFDPSEMGLRKSPGGYNLAKLGNKFRQIKVHKNRDGDRDIRTGCKFVGQIGAFEELPPAKDMTDEDYTNALKLI